MISNKSKVIQKDPSVNKVTFGYKQKCFSKPPNSPPPPDISESTRKVGVTCWRCGGNHQTFQCRYRNYTCDNCGNWEHLKCHCSQSKSKNLSPAYHIGVNPDAADDRSQSTACSRESSEELYENFSVGTKSPDAPIIVDVTIDKIPVRMEVDTGASRSMMSERKFTSIYPPRKAPALRPVSTDLRTYTKEVVPVVGSAQVTRIWKQCYESGSHLHTNGQQSLSLVISISMCIVRFLPMSKGNYMCALRSFFPTIDLSPIKRCVMSGHWA